MTLPPFSGYQGYDLFLCVEATLKGLVCAADSQLFVLHKSRGDGSSFAAFFAGADVATYWFSRFDDGTIQTINGVIKLSRPSSSGGSKPHGTYSERIEENLRACAPRMELSVLIQCRSASLQDSIATLESIARFAATNRTASATIDAVLCVDGHQRVENGAIESLQALVPGLTVRLVQTLNPDQADDQQSALLAAIRGCRSDYIWIIRDNDRVLPAATEMISLLRAETVLLGNSVGLRQRDGASEADSDRTVFEASKYLSCFTGGRIPTCSVVFPSPVLARAVSGMERWNGEHDDLAVFLRMLSLSPAITEFPAEIAASILDREPRNEAESLQWELSRATMLSEVVSAGLVSRSLYDLAAKSSGVGLSEDDRAYALVQKLDRQLAKMPRVKRFLVRVANVTMPK